MGRMNLSVVLELLLSAVMVTAKRNKGQIASERIIHADVAAAGLKDGDKAIVQSTNGSRERYGYGSIPCKEREAVPQCITSSEREEQLRFYHKDCKYGREYPCGIRNTVGGGTNYYSFGCEDGYKKVTG